MDITLPDSIELPRPQISGGMPLRDALAGRRSARAYGDRELSAQLQSDVLWSAFGVNRADSGGRTAPSARNWQEIDIYVTRADGAYRYEASQHRLQHVAAGDLRSLTGTQDFVATAALNLVYVADLSRVTASDAAERRFYCAADAGFIAQNVYLLCAAENLACVVRGLVDRRGLVRALRLGAQQRVILAQTVGYPT